MSLLRGWVAGVVGSFTGGVRDPHDREHSDSMKPDETALHFATMQDVRAWIGAQRFKCRSVCEDFREGVAPGGWKIAGTPAEYRRSRLVWPDRAERLLEGPNGVRLLASPRPEAPAHEEPLQRLERLAAVLR